jgi:hypothetical protein
VPEKLPSPATRICHGSSYSNPTLSLDPPF